MAPPGFLLKKLNYTYGLREYSWLDFIPENFETIINICSGKLIFISLKGFYWVQREVDFHLTLFTIKWKRGKNNKFKASQSMRITMPKRNMT